ncbi:MAG: hypothetical protein ABIH82_00590 [Candidatus Woesearchaeota archaeon]
MRLRDVKQQIEDLPNIHEKVEMIHKEWIRPLQSPIHAFLDNLGFEEKKALKQKLNSIKNDLNEIKVSQSINERLGHQARLLVELKLSSFKGDKTQSKILKNDILKDDIFNMTQTIYDIQEFEKMTQKVSQNYEEIGRILEQNLNLEKTIIYHELPHKIHFKRLQEMAFKQKELVHQLGKEFVMMARNK